jgi:hypothetical protein
VKTSPDNIFGVGFLGRTGRTGKTDNDNTLKGGGTINGYYSPRSKIIARKNKYIFLFLDVPLCK